MMLKRFLKNERGLTLIELLAVVVILGIIAAIAVPSIGGIIDNTKKDAHVANAQQMVSAAKLALAGKSDLAPVTGSTYINLKYLIDNGYMQDNLKDPDGTSYTFSATAQANSTAITDDGKDSYVKITRGTGQSMVFEVALYGSQRSITLTKEKSLAREKVVAKGSTSPADN